MNCKRCKHFTRAKQGEYCAKWCHPIKKRMCPNGFCVKKESCESPTEPSCEKFERKEPTEYQSGQAENFTEKEEAQ